MFARLLVMEDSELRAGGLNMALDEVLLAGLAELPLLRCYRWARPYVSFGCFGHVAQVRASHPGLPLVRRWTGGGIVRHGEDFTFSLLVPPGLPLAAGRARDAYRDIHAAVAGTLSRLGVAEVAWEPHHPKEERPAPGEAAHLKPCFSHPVANDLLSDGQKIVGGAQRRTRQGLLYQGSMQRLALLGLASDARRANLVEALAHGLARETSPREVSPEELAQAMELAARKYDAASWIERC